MINIIDVNNTDSDKIKIIGVTGNSGSGKSTVSQILKSFGGYLIDADKIAHEVVFNDKEIYVDLIKNFGTDILKDDSLELDRKKLGDIVFRNRKKLKLLNSITHPHIIRSMINAIKEFYFFRDEYKYIVIDAPLLLETGLDKISNEVWLIEANLKNKIKRLKERDKISHKSIMYRLKNQMPFEKAKKFADIIIQNDGTYDELKDKITQILTRDQ